MTVTPVASNAHARRIAAAKEARERAQQQLEEQRARRADTTTPIGRAPLMPTEELPEPPALFEEEQQEELAPVEAQAAPLVLSVTILYRGRQITISSEGRSLDAFCDLLDKRLGVAQ